MSLVTVITPTLARRQEKLLRAIDSVQAQTFRDFDHLVIPNENDPQLAALLGKLPQTRVVPLGKPHPTPGHWNRVLGGLLATSPFIAYLDDDNTWRPRHLEALVGALNAHPEAGFAYAKLAYPDGRVLGDGILYPGHVVECIDASMFVHRAELLTGIATWDPHMAPTELRYALDGFLVEAWVRAGVNYAFVNEVTVDYPQVGYWLDGGGAAPAPLARSH
jgi:glycosyltransferase involved in cell wall biosynthesis